MTISLLEGVERCLNAFIEGIGEYSPSTIVDGRSKPRGDINRIPYGAYALVYSGTKNNMVSRTVPAIALRESNGVGGYYFMSLDTGKRIHGNKWERMNITDEVIKKVCLLAEVEGQSWVHDYPFTIKSEEFTQQNDVCETNTITNEEIDHIPIVETDTNSSNQINEDEIEIEERARVTLEHLSIDDDDNDHESSHDTISDDASGTTLEASDSTYVPEQDDLSLDKEIGNESVVNSEDFSFNIANVYQEDINPTSEDSSIIDLDVPVTNLRKDYEATESDKSIQLFSVGVDYEKAFSVMFTQMSAKQGIKMFGQRAIAAMFKELKQLNDGVSPGKPVIAPIPFESLSDDNKKKALEAVNLIAQKNVDASKDVHVQMGHDNENL